MTDDAFSVVKRVDFGRATDGRPRAYASHVNEHWLEKAINPDHPLALRVYFAALGRRRRGGHAPFKVGELAELLVKPGGQLPDRRRIAEAIQRCIEWNYLAPGSSPG